MKKLGMQIGTKRNDIKAELKVGLMLLLAENEKTKETKQGCSRT